VSSKMNIKRHYFNWQTSI